MSAPALRLRRTLTQLGDYDVLGAITVRQLLGVIALWAAYCFATTYVATSVSRDPGVLVNPGWHNELRGYITDLRTTPPLARWDSIWYLSIATEGYAPQAGRGVLNGGFMPLYGLAIRGVARAFALPPLDAGIAVSCASLLVAMVALFVHGRDRGAREPLAAVIALIAFPSAYILVSVYSESLFLALLMVTWVLAERRRYLVAGVFAALAALTRFHVFALVPALFVLACTQWWPQRRTARGLLAFVPTAAAGLAVLGLGYYCHAVSGDWLLPIHLKAAFGMTTGGPLEAWRSTMVYFPEALRGHSFGNMYTLLEGPVALGMAALTCVLLWQRRWADAVLVVLCLTMNLRAGTLWGLPRYALLVFPIWSAIGRAQRWPGIFQGYVFVGLLWQACMIVNYVSSRGPAP